MRKIRQNKSLLYIVEFTGLHSGVVVWVDTEKETPYEVGESHNNWVSYNNDEYWQDVTDKNILNSLKE